MNDCPQATSGRCASHPKNDELSHVRRQHFSDLRHRNFSIHEKNVVQKSVDLVVILTWRCDEIAEAGVVHGNARNAQERFADLISGGRGGGGINPAAALSDV